MAKLSREEQNAIQVSPYQKWILLGSILGDGSLKKTKGYANCRFQMRHSSTQADWFAWKCKQLDSLLSPNYMNVQKADGFSKAEKLIMRTRALPCLTELHHEVYSDNMVDLSKPWLNELTEYSLMVWWLDDGGVMGARQGRWNCQGFGLKGAEILSTHLQERWGIRANVASYKQHYKENWKTYYYLKLGSPALRQLLKIIMPLIPLESMVKKSFMCYGSTANQQRWIDEMKQCMPHFSSKIDQLVLEIKKPSNDIVQTSS